MDKERIKIKIRKLNKRLADYKLLVDGVTKKRDKLIRQLKLEAQPDLFKVQ